MTIALTLLAGWIALALLASRVGRSFLWRTSPRIQGCTFFLATVGMVVIPPSILIIMLARTLDSPELHGSALERCGQLLVAVLKEPLARPDLTLSLLMLGAWAFAILAALRSAWRSQTESGRLVRNQIDPLVVLPSSEAFAFTAGLLRPRVVVSKALVETAPQDFLRVVLAHEQAHAKGHHPLALFVAEALARALPVPPVVWALGAFRLALEARADDLAARKVGSRDLVAQAIAALALRSVAQPAFEGGEVLRVKRLLEPQATRPVVLGGGLVALAVLLLVFIAGGHAAHCGAASYDYLRVEQCRMPM